MWQSQISQEIRIKTQTAIKAGSVTIRGCVSKSNGDYVLMMENPGTTYQLDGGKIRLKSYLGKRVEITGTGSPTLSTSEDAINKMRNASPVTLP